MKRTLAVVSLAVVACAAVAGAAERRAATIADLYRVKGVAEPAIAPDGKPASYLLVKKHLSLAAAP